MSPQFLINLLQFIAGIAILIVIHELGHFLAARFLKVEVEEFGLGFPPRMFTFFTAAGTRFSMNWIPLGGFVRLKGENDPSVEGGLAAANPWVRLTVLIAGPLMNITVGIILAIIIFYNMGEPILDRVEILDVAQDSPAALAGLQAGDLIVQVNDRRITSMDALQREIKSNEGKETQIVYKRVDQTNTVSLVPREDPPPGEGAIGILMGNPTQPTTWSRAIPTGFAVTYEYGRSVLALPIRMAQGEVSPEEGRPLGYKGMFDVYQQLQNPLWFFMVISLSLGIFNLLPIPALDGGRILFTLPEIILRRRVPPQYENMIHLVGFAMLLILLIYINLQDFINPIQLP
jgi:regulator of sigma E protease